MNSVLVVLAIVVVLAVVLLLVFTPKIRERQSAASRFVRAQIGGDDAVVKIDGMANAFGTDPSTDDELRGPGVLGLGPSALVFALTPERSVTIARADIVSATTTAQAGDSGKAMLAVVHRVDGAEVTSSWRLGDAAGWVAAIEG